MSAEAAGTATALVLAEPGRLEPRRFPLPATGDDDALLEVEACGLCGTDHEQFTGVLPAPPNAVPGHETVGVVASIGASASARWGVAEGDRVAVEVFQACESCAACAAGDEKRCERHGLGDMYGFVSSDRPPHLWGGLATHHYLAPDTRLHRVPAHVDAVVATLFNPLGAGIRWAVTLPGTRRGDVVAILGPGVRGLSAAAAARDAGAEVVMVTGAGPADTARLALAPDFGADLAVDVRQRDPAEALRSACGRLADVVVDVTAKAPDAFGQAIGLARPGGTVVVAGTRGSADTPGFWPDSIVYKELRILGALGVDSASYAAALDLLASGRYPFAELPRRVVGLDGVPALLGAMAGSGDRPVHGVVVPRA